MTEQPETPQNQVPPQNGISKASSGLKGIHIYNLVTALIAVYLANLDSGFSIGVFVFWLVIFWLLSIPFRLFGWLGAFLTSRPCPVCGMRIKNGKTVCNSCGTDFMVR